MLGLAAVFGKAASLPAYEGVSFLAFIVPVGMLQGAGFTGAATGVNLARDIERGWFDRMLLAPTPRPVLLAGVVASACLRALLPATFLLTVALALGVDWPGLLELGSPRCSSWASRPRWRATRRSSRCAFAPSRRRRSCRWARSSPCSSRRPTRRASCSRAGSRAIADVNPVTHVLEGVRQGFVGDVTWAATWPALVSIAGLVLVFGALAVRGMRRQGL